ncbi:hypothetical protein SNEBB_006626, partial [Seison nebaliae]
SITKSNNNFGGLNVFDNVLSEDSPSLSLSKE